MHGLFHVISSEAWRFYWPSYVIKALGVPKRWKTLHKTCAQAWRVKKSNENPVMLRICLCTVTAEKADSWKAQSFAQQKMSLERGVSFGNPEHFQYAVSSCMWTQKIPKHPQTKKQCDKRIFRETWTKAYVVLHSLRTQIIWNKNFGIHLLLLDANGFLLAKDYWRRWNATGSHFMRDHPIDSDFVFTGINSDQFW